MSDAPIEPIRIDPQTGLKIFATRAATASNKIAGKGYSVLDDPDLTSLPEQRPGAVFNAEEQKKYREFKEARRGAAATPYHSVHLHAAGSQSAAEVVELDVGVVGEERHGNRGVGEAL